MSTKQKTILIALGLAAIGGLAVLAVIVRGYLPPAATTPVVGCTPEETPVPCRIPLEASPTQGGDSTPEGAPTFQPLAVPDEQSLPQGPQLLTSTPTTPPTIAIASSPCPITSTGGLVTEIKTITNLMPGPGSNGFVMPSEAQMAAWELVVQMLAAGDTATACATLQANGFPYQIYQFTDTPYKQEQYLILREDAPITVGWGTYVFRVGEAAPLVVEVPHAGADWHTEVQGAEIFRKVGAKALLVAGTHRCASDAYSPCHGTAIICGQLEPYRASDLGHATQSMFQAAHQALVTCDGGLVALQLHGNSLQTCPDLFVSNGTISPGKRANRLFEVVADRCSEFTVDLADGDEGECAFKGGGPQAYTNGCTLSPIPDGCSLEALKVFGEERFLMVEQSLAVRKDYDCLVEALVDVFRDETVK